MTQPKPTTTTEEPAAIDVLLFQLDREHYALPSRSVREVVRYRTCTPVPGAPPTLPGIISQRGAILPVVELRPLLGLPEAPLARSARLVVVYHDEVDLALVAEVVFDLVALPTSTLQPVPAGLEPARAHLLSGVSEYAGKPVALLDLSALIAALRAS